MDRHGVCVVWWVNVWSLLFGSCCGSCVGVVLEIEDHASP